MENCQLVTVPNTYHMSSSSDCASLHALGIENDTILYAGFLPKYGELYKSILWRFSLSLSLSLYFCLFSLSHKSFLNRASSASIFILFCNNFATNECKNIRLVSGIKARSHKGHFPCKITLIR